MRKTLVIHCHPVCIVSMRSVQEHCSLQFRSCQHPVYKTTLNFRLVGTAHMAEIHQVAGKRSSVILLSQKFSPGNKVRKVCVRLSDDSQATVRKTKTKK